MNQKKSSAAKPKTGMARLMELAATKKPLMVSSIILSGLASVASFIPYIAIYFVVKEVMGVFPEFENLKLQRTIGYGCILRLWYALIWLRLARCMN